MTDLRAALLALLLLAPGAAQAQSERLLYDFEDPAELAGLRARCENATLDLSQDNGVTHGRSCCRVVFPQGGQYGVLTLAADRVGDWSGFAALAFDVYQEREQKWTVAVELWDAASHGYASRCTTETVVRPGRNAVVIPIDRARRNGKEGRDWSELEPQDRIDLAHLTVVKIFITTPAAGGDLVWWVDHVRLLDEAAVAGPALRPDLPARARAFAFGRGEAAIAGFTPVAADTRFSDATGFGIESGAAQAVGKGWPDALSGRGLLDPAGGEVRFAVALPDGDYRVWLAAGMAIDADAAGARYALRLGDETLYEDQPSAEAIQGEKYLYRFLATAYSQREHALWLDYIDRMYPTWERVLTVRGGRLTIAATRFWLSALVIAPAADAAGFQRFAAGIREQRIRAFEAGQVLDPQRAPARRPGDGPLLAFIPDEATAFQPSTAPNDGERARSGYDLAAAPGERVALRLGVTAFEAVGECRFALAPLRGPGGVAIGDARIYALDYRVRGDGVEEAGLKPDDRIASEAGVTRCFWAWLAVPPDAKPGTYAGAATITPAKAPTRSFPIALTVHPFRVRAPSWSLGMYYEVPADERIHRQQLAFMRDVGFTSTVLPAGRVDGIDDGRVRVAFDARAYRRVKEAGFGADPRQLQMSTALGVARSIARGHLGFGPRVDQRPGCELEDARLKPLYQDYLRRLAAFARDQGLPLAVEIVDEPREVPNPWNRTLEQTDTYADWMREAGIATGFVTPMGDLNGGRDYTPLAEHAGIISTHAGAGSQRLMRRTIELGKPLWLYNTGMDRLSWGFYAWRVGATGRWEWHFCSNDGGGAPGYPNTDEWYNPFTNRDGAAPHAPATLPGAMLFKSCFFEVAEGIRDAAYLATLEDAVRAAAGAPAKRDAVARAEAYFAELREAIPFLIDVHGLGGEDAGALVGRGLATPVAARCEAWRRRAAELIAALVE